MSIPKKIHYCWFGGAPLPKTAEKCIKSWKKYAPDFEIVQWNETNFDINENRYVKEAYEAKKWAFVTDYVRLKVVANEGGIYYDTDVELLRSPADLCEKYDGFFGFEDSEHINTGIGFGACKDNKFVNNMLKVYDDISFVKENGEFDLTPCPVRNTAALSESGLDIKNKNSIIENNIFFDTEYLCPMDYYTGKKKITKNTYSIHLYDASWCSDVSRRTTKLKRLIGVKNYCRLYGKFLHKSNRWEW